MVCVSDDDAVATVTPGGSHPPLHTQGRSARIVSYRLLRDGPLTQARLVDVTGLSRPTVAGALEGLQADGLAEAEASAQQAGGGAGRRPLVFRLTRKAGVAVGVEIGRRHIQIVVADGGHRQLVDVPPTKLTVH